MKTTVLDLGKEIYLVHTESSSEVVHLGLMVGVGSRNDGRRLSGVSHFVEHMWFKGTQKRNSTNIIEDIERFGGDFNAFTSKEETCVYVSILKDYSDVAFDVLSDIFKLTEEEKKRLANFPVGQGLFFAGQSHVHIQIIASRTEEELITTNPQDKSQSAPTIQPSENPQLTNQDLPA